MSPSINFVVIYCSQCAEVRKIAPERLYEPGSFEFPKLRPIACPLCGHGRMQPAPEYGSPSWPGRSVFPMSAESAEWMA